MPTTREKPIALIVEDDAATLEDKKYLCKNVGYQTIGVMTFKDAIREVLATPAIDIIITDVNLIPDGQMDKLGVKLARQVRDRRPGVPVVGYSGAVSRSEMDDEERKCFKVLIFKGEQDAKGLREAFNALINDALEYRRRRMEESRREVEELRLSYQFMPHEPGLRHEFVPGVAPPAQVEGAKPRAEDPAMAGVPEYRLNQIEKGACIQADETSELCTSLAVKYWLLDQKNYALAELHGHPSLYCEGEDPGEAVDGLIQLMLCTHRDFQKRKETPFSPTLASLRDYLAMVFR